MLLPLLQNHKIELCNWKKKSPLKLTENSIIWGEVVPWAALKHSGFDSNISLKRHTILLVFPQSVMFPVPHTTASCSKNTCFLFILYFVFSLYSTFWHNEPTKKTKEASLSDFWWCKGHSEALHLAQKSGDVVFQQYFQLPDSITPTHLTFWSPDKYLCSTSVPIHPKKSYGIS